MKNIVILAVISALLICCFINTNVWASDKAAPEEVVAKVKEAAAFLSIAGDEGLKEFMDPKGRWVWKNTYVWVLHCDKMTDAAHPLKHKLVGMDLGGLKDIKGNYFFIDFCEVSKKTNGGWVEYWWPKKGERKPSRKISYVLKVPNSPYQVAAGIYDEAVPINELNQFIK